MSSDYSDSDANDFVLPRNGVTVYSKPELDAIALLNSFNAAINFHNIVSRLAPFAKHELKQALVVKNQVSQRGETRRKNARAEAERRLKLREEDRKLQENSKNNRSRRLETPEEKAQYQIMTKLAGSPMFTLLTADKGEFVPLSVLAAIAALELKGTYDFTQCLFFLIDSQKSGLLNAQFPKALKYKTNLWTFTPSGSTVVYTAADHWCVTGSISAKNFSKLSQVATLAEMDITRQP